MNVLEVYDGFDGKELSDIWQRTKFEPGAIEFQSKIVRNGKGAVKIIIKEGDKKEKGSSGKDTERDELLERKDLQSKENEGCQYSFSIYLPNDFPIVSTRLVLAQWKQKEENDNALVNNPLIALRYQDGKLRITLQTTEERTILFETTDEIRDKWNDFKFNIKFNQSDSGFVKAWMNGKKIVDYKGVTAYSEKYGYVPDGTFYFKIGLYRDRMKEPMTAYFDEYRKKKL
jgi:hypothetical protein